MAKSVETLHEASWYPLDPEFETEHLHYMDTNNVPNNQISSEQPGEWSQLFSLHAHESNPEVAQHNGEDTSPYAQDHAFIDQQRVTFAHGLNHASTNQGLAVDSALIEMSTSADNSNDQNYTQGHTINHSFREHLIGFEPPPITVPGSYAQTYQLQSTSPMDHTLFHRAEELETQGVHTHEPEDYPYMTSSSLDGVLSTSASNLDDHDGELMHQPIARRGEDTDQNAVTTVSSHHGDSNEHKSIPVEFPPIFFLRQPHEKALPVYKKGVFTPWPASWVPGFKPHVTRGQRVTKLSEIQKTVAKIPPISVDEYPRELLQWPRSWSFEPFYQSQMYAWYCTRSHIYGGYIMAGDHLTCHGCDIQKSKRSLNLPFFLPPGSYRVIRTTKVWQPGAHESEKAFHTFIKNPSKKPPLSTLHTENGRAVFWLRVQAHYYPEKSREDVIAELRSMAFSILPEQAEPGPLEAPASHSNSSGSGSGFQDDQL